MGPCVRRDDEYDSAFSRHTAPEFCNSFRPQKERGRREDRVHAAPAVPCAKVDKKNAHEHTGSAEAIRPSLRDGVTAYFVLSPARPCLFVTVVAWTIPRNLTPAIGASGPHDFAVRERLRSSFANATATASHRAQVTSEREQSVALGTLVNGLVHCHRYSNLIRTLGVRSAMKPSRSRASIFV